MFSQCKTNELIVLHGLIYKLKPRSTSIFYILKRNSGGHLVKLFRGVTINA